MRRLRFVIIATVALLAVLVPRAGAVAPPSAGYNDWSCAPSAAHPHPVVLVHGLGANGSENWSVIGPMLAANGYCAYSLTYGVNPALGPLWSQVGGLLTMEQSAVQLSDFVQRVLSASGAAKVDIVGHSEGSLMPDWYVKFLGGSAYVDHYVGMTPLWQGSNLAGLGTLASLGGPSGLTARVESIVTGGGCPSCTEFLTGSSFLAALNGGGGPAVAGVTYTMLMTSHDEVVFPYTSGYLYAPTATNIVVQNQCVLDLSGHAGMAVDTIVERDILNALDPATAVPPKCTLQAIAI